MLRILAEYALPLALPTAVYFIVQWWIAYRSAKGEPVVKPSWWDAPWPWLGVAGILLLLLTLAVLSLLEGSPPEAVYRPPEVIDGKVSPGGFDEPKP